MKITIPEKTISVTIPAYTVDVPDPVVAPKELFSPLSIIRKRLVGNEKVASNSAALVDELVRFNNSIGTWINCGDAYNSGIYVVKTPIAKVPVTIKQPGRDLSFTALYKECIAGLPIPANAQASKGGDGHCFIWYQPEDLGIEFWQLRTENGQRVASWGAVLKNVSQHMGYIPKLPSGERQGSRACGLTLWGYIITLDELKSGVIPHAIGIAPPYPSNKFVAPAVDSDGYATKQSWMPSWMWPTPGIPEGQLFRFPANIPINPAWTPFTKMVVTAIRDYGAYVVDKSDDKIVFACENRSQYGEGESVYYPFFGGKQLWDVVKEIPYSQLVALEGK